MLELMERKKNFFLLFCPLFLIRLQFGNTLENSVIFMDTFMRLQTNHSILNVASSGWNGEWRRILDHQIHLLNVIVSEWMCSSIFSYFIYVDSFFDFSCVFCRYIHFCRLSPSKMYTYYICVFHHFVLSIFFLIYSNRFLYKCIC